MISERFLQKIREKVDVADGKKAELFHHPRIQEAVERYLVGHGEKKKTSAKNSPSH